MDIIESTFYYNNTMYVYLICIPVIHKPSIVSALGKSFFSAPAAHQYMHSQTPPNYRGRAGSLLPTTAHNNCYDDC